MKKFINSDEGATMIEYAVIAMLVAMVLVGTLTTIGTSVSSYFQLVANKFP